MSEVNFNAVVNAHADRVWQTLSQFGRISDWHPAICSSEIEDNQPDGRPGCRRRLVPKTATSCAKSSSCWMQVSGPSRIALLKRRWPLMTMWLRSALFH